ncbi:MAG: sigma 54-interacting transcriptional regulator [Acidobacteriia bacterium]|nr:sigma 54-interacting transcriptional regulator [Terriglobia bacterium]
MSAPSEAAGLLEHLFFEIAEGVSGQTGEAFVHSLARHLAAALKADFVLVGELQPGGRRIATLAAYSDGKDAPAFEYDLDGTPCANVVEKQLCSYPSGIQRMFPKDLMLAELGAEGYVGSPMIDSGGRCLGLVCALTRQPLQHAKLAETVLQIFAVRASSELERKNYEEGLARSEQHYRALVSHGNEAVLRVELDQPIALDLPEQEQLELIYQHAYVADCNEQAAKLFGRATAQDLIGARMEAISPRGDPEQVERTLAGIRARWQFSQVERTMQGRVLLMTRQGIIENGKYTGAWVTARDITELKQAEAEVLRLNAELQQHVAELTELKGRLEQDNAYLLEEIKADHNNHEMIGSSPKFRELLDRIRLVAGTSATVLITGETGTGKELVARAIHNLSPRRNRPLVKVNCAAISAGLVESELFGHVKGAFTGATDRRIGRFEHAHGGTLFLDEITELPLESQSKILRVLQEQEFEPVGSNRTVKVDVRILAATNRNLAEAVREGRFRMDLYYRLLVIPVEVPPLRERREDIPALATHFVKVLARQFGRRVHRISEATMRQLMDYDWPGNVRELENLLARAVVLSPGEVLDAPLDLVAAHGSAEAASLQSLPSQSLEDAERCHIERVLASTNWVVEGPKGAARILEMNPSTLRSLMKRLGIRRPA